MVSHATKQALHQWLKIICARMIHLLHTCPWHWNSCPAADAWGRGGERRQGWPCKDQHPSLKWITTQLNQNMGLYTKEPQSELRQYLCRGKLRVLRIWLCMHLSGFTQITRVLFTLPRLPDFSWESEFFLIAAKAKPLNTQTYFKKGKY